MTDEQRERAKALGYRVRRFGKGWEWYTPEAVQFVTADTEEEAWADAYRDAGLVKETP